MDMKQTNWYVITGAPSSGKTTVLNALSELGYRTIPEAARVLIDEEMARGKTLEEIRKDEAEFQRKTLEIKVDIEKNTPTDEIVFFDRAIPDSTAYYQTIGQDHEEVYEVCNEHKYKKVFFFERVPFEKDYARTENEETTERLNNLLHKAYSDLGYEVVTIPTVKTEDRIKIILDHIEK